jgi:hypothetical protein
LDAEREVKAPTRATVRFNHQMETPSERHEGRHDVDLGEPLADDNSEEDESFEQGELIILPGLEDDVIPPQIQQPLMMQQQRQSRAGCTIRPTSLWLESLEQQRQGIVALLAVPWEVFYDDEYTIQGEMENPMAFVASSNPDIMYLDEAMKQPDKLQFQQAMIEEVKSQTDNENWEVISREKVPMGTKVLPAVWAMRRKR